MDPILRWLLEPSDPSTRYLTLRQLLGRPHHDPELLDAQSAIVRLGSARAILDAQYSAGYWVKPDRGYSPKYKATIWQLILLADLGVKRTEPIARACEHTMRVALRADLGLFSAHKHSTGLYPCLNGDLLWALSQFGYREHKVVRAVVDGLAKWVVEGGFICPRNSGHPRDMRTWLPCIWGCVKALRGFAAASLPGSVQAVQPAVERGLAFLQAHDLTGDLHPALIPERSHWLRFGFPLGYGSDLLEALSTLAELGIRADQLREREKAIAIIVQKQDDVGRWPLEFVPENTWADFGSIGQPSKRVTLRALKILKWLEASESSSDLARQSQT